MDKTHVYVAYAAEDAALASEFLSHLRPLEHSGVIRAWHVGQVHAGDNLEEARARELATADLILILLSSSLLASDRGVREIESAAQRARQGAKLVPILLRPCIWEQHEVLDSRQVLPRDHRPVTSSRDRSEAWVEVVSEIMALIRFRADRVAPSATPLSGERRDIGDIFRTSGSPDITFVEPAQLPRLRALLRMMGQGLVVEGPSGIGKTTIVRRALAGFAAVPQQWLLGPREADRALLDERLAKGFKGYLIIDDFHRLDRERQIRVADAMKIIADLDERDAKIIVIGINPVGESLLSALSELAGRFELISMGRQPAEKISELIKKGESAANIVFQRREEFVLAAAGSFFTAQQLCYEAALRADIHETAPVRTRVDVGFRDVVDAVVHNLEGKYFGALRAFACHDERVPPRGATLALLFLLARSSEGHVSLEDVYYQYTDSEVRGGLALLKSSYLSRCFDEKPELRSLFYFNKSAGILSIEDPRLGFYLSNMVWPDFIKRTGHRAARIDAEGNLVFSKAAGEAARGVHVLHLSDLHFSELPQADVWHGQLIEDLRELECDHIDALVVSGDLTQRANPREFEAVRRFLLRLSTDLRLSPGQVLMVPGNHDMSRPLSKAAYSLHRREDYQGELASGTYIAHGASVIEVRDPTRYAERFASFNEFYSQIKGAPYPLEYADQIELVDLASERLLFVGFNSAWQVDHEFTERAGIHPQALTQALERLRRMPGAVDRIKIAVWHHPISGDGEARITDQGVLQQLAKAGFRIILHGHIHKASREQFRYDAVPDGRRIEVIAAGTFGAPTRDWAPGYPLQYNLLRFFKDRVVVETRRREEPNGAWQPDARWLQGSGKDPLPRYEVLLSGE